MRLLEIGVLFFALFRNMSIYTEFLDIYQEIIEID